MLPAVGPPLSIKVMHLASAEGSPAASLSMISSGARAGSFAVAGSDNDKGMSKAELLAKQAHDLAVSDADLGGLDDPLVNVLALAVGGARPSASSARPTSAWPRSSL